MPTGFEDGNEDVVDADADPTNELQDLELSDNMHILCGDDTPVSLSQYIDETGDHSLEVNISFTNDIVVNGLAGYRLWIF